MRYLLIVTFEPLTKRIIINQKLIKLNLSKLLKPTTETMNKQKIKRLTMNDLNDIVEHSVKRIVQESRQDDDIRLAHKELYKMSSSLSSIGMRLEGTRYHQQYKRIYDELVKLNNALIKHIRGGK